MPPESPNTSPAQPREGAIQAGRPAPPHPDSNPEAPAPHAAPPRPSWSRRLLLGGVGLVVLAAAAYFLIPWVITSWNTVSTDDAYVNGHVTFVAPRVAGQVMRVLVDDNYRVKKGDLLVQLDKEPFQVQVAIKKAALTSAEADLKAAQARVYGQVGQTRAARFKLEHAIEDVKTQVANLSAAVATLASKKANLELAQANLVRGEAARRRNSISQEELDQRRQAVQVDEAAVEQARQEVYALRAGLGIPVQPPAGRPLTDVPENLDQTFSKVREALATLVESAAQFGYFPTTWEATPKQVIADFYKQDKKGDLNAIYAKLIPQAPAIKQAEAKLLQARRDLDQAELDLRYTDVVAEIDGVVTRRNVNPGNNVAVGQNLMAVRSLTEIWIDANFKETQLANLRIGQRAKLEVDMYGSRKEFEGRITGFTFGTGQTLALLPPQNATGNFVKIVQRLPVRIELTDYDPQREPLFVGLSVTPYVYFREPATGPNAGQFLQPHAPLPKGPTDPRP